MSKGCLFQSNKWLNVELVSRFFDFLYWKWVLSRSMYKHLLPISNKLKVAGLMARRTTLPLGGPFNQIKWMGEETASAGGWNRKVVPDQDVGEERRGERKGTRTRLTCKPPCAGSGRDHWGPFMQNDGNMMGDMSQKPLPTGGKCVGLLRAKWSMVLAQVSGTWWVPT